MTLVFNYERRIEVKVPDMTAEQFTDLRDRDVGAYDAIVDEAMDEAIKIMQNEPDRDGCMTLEDYSG